MNLCFDATDDGRKNKTENQIFQLSREVIRIRLERLTQDTSNILTRIQGILSSLVYTILARTLILIADT